MPAGWYPDPTGRNEHRYWDGATWTEHVATRGVSAVDPPTMGTGPQAAWTASAGAPGAGAAGPPRDRANPIFAFLGLASGFFLMVGSFLPWVTLDYPGLPGDSSGGMNHDGPFTLVLGIAIGVVALLVALAVVPWWGGWIVAGVGGIAAALSIADAADFESNDYLNVGFGLWLCIVAAVLAAVFGVLAAVLRQPRARPSAG
jgi:hypothetical protein